jgi:AcrR family transcriptional regulator
MNSYQMTHANSRIGKEKWLEVGYRQFAEHGPDLLSINKISHEIGTSRASFYHYFGDIGNFIDDLLSMHWQTVERFIITGKDTCQNLFPDLYDLIAEYPVSQQFSMQLFHARSNPEFNFLFIKMYEAIAKAFALKLFAMEYQLNQNENDVYKLWLTVGETWYSRLSPQDLSSSTLQKHAREIMKSVSNFMNSQLYSSLREPT